MSSRVNVFLVATTARGGIVNYVFARLVLAHLQTRSEFRRPHLDTLEYVLTENYELSFRHRWLLWSLLPAIGLLLWLFARSIRLRDVADLFVTVPMVLQLGAIFLFLIAAEYRYLLPFYLLPRTLLPMAVLGRQAHCSQSSSPAQARSASSMLPVRSTQAAGRSGVPPRLSLRRWRCL